LAVVEPAAVLIRCSERLPPRATVLVVPVPTPLVTAPLNAHGAASGASKSPFTSRFGPTPALVPSTSIMSST